MYVQKGNGIFFLNFFCLMVRKSDNSDREIFDVYFFPVHFQLLRRKYWLFMTCIACRYLELGKVLQVSETVYTISLLEVAENMVVSATNGESNGHSL